MGDVSDQARPAVSTEPTPTAHRDVLLVGASRGLGLAITGELLRRGARVVATVRSSGEQQLHDLAASVGAADRLEVEHVDTVEAEQVRALRDRLTGRSFDLLLVNAGTTHDQALTAASISTEEFDRVMVTNALAPVRLLDVCDALVEPGGTVAVMSSGQGSISQNDGGGWEVYRASKAALNQLVRSYAARHDDGVARRAVVLLAPGWVRTDLGGSGATATVDQAVPPLVSTLEDQRGRPGVRFLDRDGNHVSW